MRVFADTNWLIANYFSIEPGRVALLRRFTERADYPWHVAPIIRLECENHFGNLSGVANSKEWQKFQSHFGTKLVEAHIDQESLFARTKALIQRFSHKAKMGTADMMFLATALHCEATHILSFDTGSNLRALAAHLKLKVFPELTAGDKRRIAAFR